MPELYRYHCGLICRSRYWPWVGLISIIVLFAAVIVIKWGDKVCFHLSVIKFEIKESLMLGNILCLFQSGMMADNILSFCVNFPEINQKCCRSVRQG